MIQVKPTDDFLELAPFFERMGPVFSIVEIGCHLMEDTTFLRERFPLASIVCFEPDMRAVKELLASAVPASLNAQIFPLAVGHQAGKVQFWQSTNGKADAMSEHWHSSSVRKPKNFGEKADLVVNPCIFEPFSVSVLMTPLDGFVPLAHLKQVDLLWIDAQGAEDLILAGAKKFLAGVRWLYVEHNTAGMYEGAPDLSSIRQFLKGWEPAAVFPYNALFRNSKYDHPINS